MFVPVIAVFNLLSAITAGEGRCESPRRGRHLHYNVKSDPDFRLWLKMDEKNTQLNVSLVLNSGTASVRKNHTFVWSNTDVYTGFLNKHIKKEIKIGANDIVRDVIVAANASMEWIFCKNAFTFPVMPASNNPNASSVPASNNPNASSVPASNTKVVAVLVVVVVVLVVVLAAAGAYIHRLRNNLNQLVASQFKSKIEVNSKQFKSKIEDNSKHNGAHLPKCDRLTLYPAAAPASPGSGAPLPDGLQENIYEEWQERPALTAASHHSSSNSIYGLVVNLPQEHTP